MKTRIHVDIPNEKDEVECYETKGNFLLAVKALWAIWRYGKGRIMIGEIEGQNDG